MLRSMESNCSRLSDPFLVLATQNPLEYEGTYRLPEAQLDRFLLKLNIDYPPPEEEDRILRLYQNRSDRQSGRSCSKRNGLSNSVL